MASALPVVNPVGVMSTIVLPSSIKYKCVCVPATVRRLLLLSTKVMRARHAPLIADVVRARQPPTGCRAPSYQRTRFASDQVLACCRSVPFLTTPGGGAMLRSGTIFTCFNHVAELFCAVAYLLSPSACVKFDARKKVIATFHRGQGVFEA